MCGRFTLTIDTVSALAALLGVTADPRLAQRYRPRWNVAPTDVSPLLLAEPGGARALVEARWGISYEGSGAGPQILARAETVTAKPKLRALARRRCVVPADGFFEWGGPKGDRRPFWYHAADGGLLLFAGIHHRTPEGESFAIVTTASNELVSKVHDRMPAVLAKEQVARWLDGDDMAVAAAQLAPAPEGVLVVQPVGKRVNDVANDDPSCLEPWRDERAAEPARPRKPGQMKLF